VVFFVNILDKTDRHGMWCAGHCRLDGDDYKRKIKIDVA
jgi:hypothetical protein